ncbi:MAG TPA: NUDIX domain-containing protein [Gemmatimonadaceae bacterium]|nr:NUDIX domain-containing protein [Gemmatimonadaceae bacterium]
MTSRRTRVGVGVIVVRDERVLIGRRRGAHGAGTWALPGGNLEFGESAEECARRELLEEAGMTLQAVRPAAFTVDNFVEHDRHYVTLFVEADGVSGTERNCEPDRCDGWEWHDWHALPTPLFGPLASLVAQGHVPAGVPAAAPA